jgi:hypothetical protein
MMTKSIKAPWDLIVQDYHAGMNQHALAAKYNITQGTISYQLRKRTIVRPPKYAGPYSKIGDKLDHTFICSEYKKGKTAIQISRDLGVNRGVIDTLLKKYNLERHLCLTETIDNEYIISMYLSGVSIKKLAKEFNVSPTPIKEILIKHSVDIKPPTCYKKYKCNKNAFDNLTPESEYWLGMMATDGCVYYTKYGKARISLQLQARDKHHIEKFNQFLESDYPLYRTSKITDGVLFYYWRICIADDELAYSLSKYNIVPQKTHVLNISDVRLLNSKHFWRGVLDGDGCIQPRGVYKIMCSSKIFVEQFQSFVNKYGSLPTLRTDIKENRTYWSISGSSQKMLIDMYSYKGPAILDRKYDTVKNLIEEKTGKNETTTRI